MSTKSQVVVRLDDDIRKMLDIKRENLSISEYVISLIKKDQKNISIQSDIDINNDISDIKRDIKKLLNKSDINSDIVFLDSKTREKLSLALIMFGYEKDKRAVDPTKGNESHWCSWIQTKSSYPQDEQKINQFLDSLRIQKKFNPFSKK